MSGVHPDSFYRPLPGGFESLPGTRGPWDAESQHAGPPAALVGRAIESCGGIGDDASERLVVRVAIEILRPVPIAPVGVSARVIRPGRRVDMVEASLTDDEGRELVSARGWRMLRNEIELPAGLASADPASPAQGAGLPGGGPAPPPPAELERADAFFPTGHEIGYHSAMEYRFASGSFLDPGPATTWMRMRQPLLPGEKPSPLQRVLIAADTGNGISATLDFDRYLFINVDLTVHLHRMPVGEWVCLDSLTIPEPTGVGLADTMLLDERGPIGRAAQSLLVAER